MKPKFIIGLDTSKGKDFSAISVMKDDDLLISKATSNINDVVKLYYETLEKWLYSKGVTLENAHEYTLKENGIKRELWKDDKLVGILIVLEA